MSEKIALCAIRTAGILVTVIVLIAGARALELDYDDARTVLGIFNAYFPEFVALAIFVAVATVFYRATFSNDDFSFVYFFVTRPDRHEDLWKLGYFVLLVVCVWLIFTLVWRDKPIETALGIILGAFILKNIADTAGKALGKPRDEQPPPTEGGKQ